MPEVEHIGERILGLLALKQEQAEEEKTLRRMFGVTSKYQDAMPMRIQTDMEWRYSSSSDALWLGNGESFVVFSTPDRSGRYDAEGFSLLDVIDEDNKALFLLLNTSMEKEG